MTDKIFNFLASRNPLSEEDQVWGNGDLAFTVRAYICQDCPPLEYVTSVRALVFQDDKLLTITDEQATHILPGGRVEKGETREATLRREVLEETGWTLRNIRQIGFLHYRHQNLKPPEYRYPYPDFIQLVYMADADVFQPDSLS